MALDINAWNEADPAHDFAVEVDAEKESRFLLFYQVDKLTCVIDGVRIRHKVAKV